MTPVFLILFGLLLLGLTIWDLRREESDVLFWMDSGWWEVSKSTHPWLFRMAIVGQFAAAVLMMAVGVVWLVFFR